MMFKVKIIAECNGSFGFTLNMETYIVIKLLWYNHLLIVLVSLVVDNVEEPELVSARGGGHHAKPIAELLLLEVLLRPALCALVAKVPDTAH